MLFFDLPEVSISSMLATDTIIPACCAQKTYMAMDRIDKLARCLTQKGRQAIATIGGCCFLSAFACYPATSFPRQATSPGTPSVTAQSTMESEIIEIHRLMALPSKIQRPPGKFRLILDNQTGNRQASFVIDPSSVGEGALSPEPLFVYNRTTAAAKDKMSRILDLPAGQYFLKSIPSGHILCIITLK